MCEIFFLSTSAQVALKLEMKPALIIAGGRVAVVIIIVVCFAAILIGGMGELP